MSQPNDIGPITQLLDVTIPQKYGHKRWHTFEIQPALRGGEAGRWCNSNIRGQWTFEVVFGMVIFYIKDPKDAMLFKLAWAGQ